MKRTTYTTVLLLLTALTFGVLAQEFDFFDPEKDAKKKAEEAALKARYKHPIFLEWYAKYKGVFKLPKLGQSISVKLANGRTESGKFWKMQGDTLIMKQGRVQQDISKSDMSEASQRQFYVHEYATYYALRKYESEKHKQSEKERLPDPTNMRAVSVDIGKKAKAILIGLRGAQVHSEGYAANSKSDTVIKIGVKVAPGGRGHALTLAYLEDDYMGPLEVGDSLIRISSKFFPKIYAEKDLRSVVICTVEPYLWLKSPTTGKKERTKVGTVTLSRKAVADMQQYRITTKNLPVFAAKKGKWWLHDKVKLRD